MTQQRPKRPRRKRKGDRLLNPGASKEEIMVDHAIASFDRAAIEMERKWGYDRLPELVSPETAQRYGAAIAFLNEAINETNPQKAVSAAQNAIKGLAVLDAEAERLGHTQPSPLFSGDADGWGFRVIADAGDPTPNDGIPAFTIREVGLALKAQLNAVADVKQHFDKAEATNITPKRSFQDDDLIDVFDT